MNHKVKPTRNTPQRALILSIMKDNYSHPTADEIYELARMQDVHISRGTVYRNLNLLSEMNEIRRLSMPSGPDHFDCKLENHYHFLCRNCKKVVDTSLPYNTTLNEATVGLPGYKTDWHRLVLVGLCSDCNK